MRASTSRSLVQPQLVKFKSFDGMEIGAFMYLPPGARRATRCRSSSAPTAVPSRSSVRISSATSSISPSTASVSMAVNPRGSSGYGREFLDMDNYKDRWKSVKDYEMATAGWSSRGMPTQRKIGVTGGSYGGLHDSGLHDANPDLYAAGIDIVGIANFYTFLMNTAPYAAPCASPNYGPLTDSAFLVEISPISKRGQDRRAAYDRAR